jgi:CRISPR-associated protein Cas6
MNYATKLKAEEATILIVEFPIRGERLPADHGYTLYGAISRVLPELHESGWLGIELISGIPWDKGLIVLPTKGAKLRLRLPSEKFGAVLPLAGKRFDIEGFQIRVGIPLARPLLSATSLYARIVTIRPHTEPAEFLAAANRQLEANNIKATLKFPRPENGRSRRIVTIRGKKVVGFSLVAHGLSDTDSIKLQAIGLGGRRAMGCGIFNPISKPCDFEEKDNDQ